MEIRVSDEVALSPFSSQDVPPLVEHLAAKAIYDRTLRIPYPYGEQDGRAWLARVAEEEQQRGYVTNFAIRDASGKLIGACGFEGVTPGHRAEIGYWLAEPFWGRGIMTQVVAAACHYAFGEWKLVRICGHVFAFNHGSARVLEKNGFQFEGLLRKHHRKDGQLIDSKLYAKLA